MWNEEAAANPFWTALCTEQAGMAIGGDLARRYPAEVLPFAGVREISEEALAALRDLMYPEETVLVKGDIDEAMPEVEGLEMGSPIPCWQMRLPEGVTIAMAPDDAMGIVELRAEQAESMVELTNAAFPGFFRPESYRLGSYFGVRDKGELVAMGGERVALPGAREISAVCTRPGHTGRGYAARLLAHLVSRHAGLGLQSFLHVSGPNTRAIALYERLGFVKTRGLLIHKITRKKTTFTG